MATKLNWTYDDVSGEHRAMHNGFRIRAVQDSYSSNPLTDGDMNWPVVVRSGNRGDRRFTSYVFGEENNTFACPFEMLNDALLIHWQVHITNALGTTVRELLDCYGNSDDALAVGKVISRDADALRNALTEAWKDSVANSDKLDLAAEIMKMADITALSTTVTGYSQGDWAEVLVVATPEAIEKFGCTEPVKPEDLQATADLYGAWAWGDVYGYVIEKRTGSGCDIMLDTDGPKEERIGNFPSLEDAEEFLHTSATIDPDLLAAGKYSFCDYEDPEAAPWEEIPDGVCWGFYGSDFDKSGLEEAALEACPGALPAQVDA